MYDYMYAHKYAASISEYDLSDFIFKVSIYMYLHITLHSSDYRVIIIITILCYNIDIHTCINYKYTIH